MNNSKKSSRLLMHILIAAIAQFSAVSALGDGISEYRPHVMQIGVHITYNNELQDKFEKTNRDPHYYFTVLLNAVETRLATVQYPAIELTLVGTNAINKSDDIETETMEKHEILRNFTDYFITNRQNLGSPDAAFYVTWSYFMEQESDEASWLATAKIGGLCGNASVGMFYDDGETFLGVHAMSRELAFLIGASRDNLTYGDCSRRLRYLTSLLDDTTQFRLSRCAQANITRFFLSNKENNCWNDTPKAIIQNNWTLPSKYLEGPLTNKNVDLCRSHLFYLPVFEQCSAYSTVRKSATCRLSCCYEDSGERSGYVVELDGRECGFWRRNMMCIHGECVAYS